MTFNSKLIKCDMYAPFKYSSGKYGGISKSLKESGRYSALVKNSV